MWIVDDLYLKTIVLRVAETEVKEWKQQESEKKKEIKKWRKKTLVSHFISPRFLLESFNALQRFILTFSCFVVLWPCGKERVEYLYI